MRRKLSLRGFYELDLHDGEEIRTTATAYAGGAGSRIMLGMLAGALFGWLGAIYLDAAALPALVLGACAGLAAAYFWSVRVARSPDGPGAVELRLILTNLRLLTTPRHTARRQRVLRSYDLAQIAEVTTHRYPVTGYRRQQITMKDGSNPAFIVSRKLPIEPVNADPTSG